MTAKWDVALDKLLEMYIGWASQPGERYAKVFLDSWIDANEDVVQREAQRNIWKGFHGRIEHQLWRADPIYIDPDMMTLIEAASKEFQPEPLLESDLITPYGFAYFPRPFYFQISDPSDSVHHLHNGRLAYRYILWGMEYHKFTNGTTMPVLIITIWRDPADLDDFEQLPGFTYPQILTIIPWPTDGTTMYPSKNPGIPGQWEQVAKPLQTLWRLMSQTITLNTKERPSRDTRRRVDRSKYLEKQITVIKLRRSSNDSGNHEPRVVNWTHRFIVSGFWRNQFYPSIDAHRQIWISDYIKGDPDLPLIIKPRIFKLER